MKAYLPSNPGWDLPECEFECFFEKRSRICVVIPVLNEGERFLAQMLEMKPLLEKYDTLICDGGSSDGSTSPERVRALGARAVLFKKGAGKLSSQLRLAYAFAMEEGYDGVITIDGNNKDGVAAIPEFAKLLQDGYDGVFGSRFIPGGVAINTPGSRKWAIRLIHAPVMSLASRKWLTDTTNGFRAYGRRLLLDPRVQPFRGIFSVYNLPYYLTARACRLGFKVTEAPVLRRYPADGTVPTKIGGVRGKVGIIRELLGVLFGAYDP